MNLRDQYCEGKHHTIEEEGDHVSYDFTNKEEAVYHVHFLPKLYFLQKCTLKKEINNNNNNNNNIIIISEYIWKSDQLFSSSSCFLFGS